MSLPERKPALHNNKVHIFTLTPIYIRLILSNALKIVVSVSNIYGNVRPTYQTLQLQITIAEKNFLLIK